MKAFNTVKPEKDTTIKFHENALKQFSRRLKFTNLASEPQKILTYLFCFLNVFNPSDTPIFAATYLAIRVAHS